MLEKSLIEAQNGNFAKPMLQAVRVLNLYAIMILESIKENKALLKWLVI